jgi:hypothetical protein
LKVSGDIREAMDQQKLTILVLYDFSNAFPSVHHGLLLSKLRLLGISDSVLTWFKSYLSDRMQKVVNGDDVSELISLEHGVPQGSVLGPLLFSLYVNDIQSAFTKSKIHLYADDLQDYMSFRADGIYQAVQTMNYEADNLVKYSTPHNLMVNPNKTQIVIIGNNKILKKLPDNLPPIVINGTHVPYSETVNNLGVLFD